MQGVNLIVHKLNEIYAMEHNIGSSSVLNTISKSLFLASSMKKTVQCLALAHANSSIANHHMFSLRSTSSPIQSFKNGKIFIDKRTRASFHKQHSHKIKQKKNRNLWNNNTFRQNDTSIWPKLDLTSTPLSHYVPHKICLYALQAKKRIK